MTKLNNPVYMLAIMVLLSLQGCVRADDDHCTYREGDKTCGELGNGNYCSKCVGDNNGCVVERPPSQSCYAPQGNPFTPGTSTSTSTGSGTEAATGPVLCDSQGRDDTCPSDSPYCLEGVCSSCADGHENFCYDLDPAAPECSEDGCVSCIPDPSVCGVGAWCNASLFSCGGCTEHSQCPDSACEIGTGECMPTDLVLHASRAGCAAAPAKPGSGTEADPYCELSVAIDAVPAGGRGTIIMHNKGAGPFAPILISASDDKVVAFIGLGGPALSGSQPIRVQGQNTTAYFQGLNLVSSSLDGLFCEGGATVWGNNLDIKSNGVGLAANGCSVELTQSSIRTNDGDGIRLTNGAFLRMQASNVFQNGEKVSGSTALYCENSGFEIVYSTLISNGTMGLGLRCEGTVEGTTTVRNSIVAGPNLESIDCQQAEFTYCAVDTDFLAGENNLLLDSYDPQWWSSTTANSLRLSDNPEQGPFGGVARWQLGDPAFDIFGPEPFAPGQETYAGGHQP